MTIQRGRIAVVVVTGVALNPNPKSLLANICESGAVFLVEVAQHDLLAQQPGLHVFCTGESETIQVRLEAQTGAVVSEEIIINEIAIRVSIGHLITRLFSDVEFFSAFETPQVCYRPAMTLAARLLFAFLAINLAALTPIVPGTTGTIVRQKHSCCADMNVKGGVRCPINSGSTTSSMATCCSGPAACLCLYFGNINPFSAQTQLSGAILLNNVLVTTRSQPPPVPPPRTAFS